MQTSGEIDEGRHYPEHTVLGRSASIMEAFNCSRPVLSLSDLNRRTRLPKSTLHRLLDQLCQVGWLERDHGGYRIGMRMFELGTLAVDGNRLHEAALPHLQALATKTGLAAQLAVLDRAEVVYLERIVAAPIRGSGQAVGAVSVTGPAGRMRWGAVTEAVRGAAVAIWNANLNLRGAAASRL
jgi:DNA-binding IclR family transcriptional regulator